MRWQHTTKLHEMKDRPQYWLLIEQRDDEAHSDRRNVMIKERDPSAFTGRTMKDLTSATKAAR